MNYRRVQDTAVHNVVPRINALVGWWWRTGGQTNDERNRVMACNVEWDESMMMMTAATKGRPTTTHPERTLGLFSGGSFYISASKCESWAAAAA